MHRPTIIFLLSHKITTVQQKTTNRNNQSHQTITTNNPRNHSIKNNQKQTFKTNTKNHLTNQSQNQSQKNHDKQSTQSLKKTRSNKHNKPSHQSIVKSITENNRITFSTNNYSFYHIKMCCRRNLPRKPANNTHLIKTWHNRTRQPG